MDRKTDMDLYRKKTVISESDLALAEKVRDARLIQVGNHRVLRVNGSTVKLPANIHKSDEIIIEKNNKIHFVIAGDSKYVIKVNPNEKIVLENCKKIAITQGSKSSTISDSGKQRESESKVTTENKELISKLPVAGETDNTCTYDKDRSDKDTDMDLHRKTIGFTDADLALAEKVRDARVVQVCNHKVLRVNGSTVKLPANIHKSDEIIIEKNNKIHFVVAGDSKYVIKVDSNGKIVLENCKKIAITQGSKSPTMGDGGKRRERESKVTTENKELISKLPVAGETDKTYDKDRSDHDTMASGEYIDKSESKLHNPRDDSVNDTREITKSSAADATDDSKCSNKQFAGEEEGDAIIEDVTAVRPSEDSDDITRPAPTNKIRSQSEDNPQSAKQGDVALKGASGENIYGSTEDKESFPDKTDVLNTNPAGLNRSHARGIDVPLRYDDENDVNTVHMQTGRFTPGSMTHTPQVTEDLDQAIELLERMQIFDHSTDHEPTNVGGSDKNNNSSTLCTTQSCTDTSTEEQISSSVFDNTDVHSTSYAFNTSAEHACSSSLERSQEMRKMKHVESPDKSALLADHKEHVSSCVDRDAIVEGIGQPQDTRTCEEKIQELVVSTDEAQNNVKLKQGPQGPTMENEGQRSRRNKNEKFGKSAVHLPPVMGSTSVDDDKPLVHDKHKSSRNQPSAGTNTDVHGGARPKLQDYIARMANREAQVLVPGNSDGVRGQDMSARGSQAEKNASQDSERDPQYQPASRKQDTVSLFKDSATASVTLYATLPTTFQLIGFHQETEILEIPLLLDKYMQYKYVLQSPTMLADVNSQLKQSKTAPFIDSYKRLFINRPIESLSQRDKIVDDVLEVLFDHSQTVCVETRTGVKNADYCAMSLMESKINILYAETIDSDTLSLVYHNAIKPHVKELLSNIPYLKKMENSPSDEKQLKTNDQQLEADIVRLPPDRQGSEGQRGDPGLEADIVPMPPDSQRSEGQRGDTGLEADIVKQQTDDQHVYTCNKETESEHKPTDIEEVIEMDIVWQRLFQKFRIGENIIREVVDVEIVTCEKAGMWNIIITGLPANVKSATKVVKTWKRKLAYRNCQLQLSVMDIFFKTNICHLIEHELAFMKLDCVLTLSENHDLLIYGASEDVINKAAAHVVSMLTEEKLFISEDSRHKVKDVFKQVEDKYPNRVVIVEDETETVYVTGFKKEVCEVVNDIQRKLEIDKTDKITMKTIKFSQDEVFKYLKSSKFLADCARTYDVDINEIRSNSFEMKGQHDLVIKFDKELSKYATQVKTDTLECNSATVVSYFESKECTTFVAQIQDDYSVLIEGSSNVTESCRQSDVLTRHKKQRITVDVDRRDGRATWRFPMGHKLVLYLQDISQSDSQFVVTSIQKSNRASVKMRPTRGSVTHVDVTVPEWTDGTHAEREETIDTFHNVLTLAGQDKENVVAFPLPAWRSEDLATCLVMAVGRYFLSVTENDQPRFAVIQTGDQQLFTKAVDWCQTAVDGLTADKGSTTGPEIKVRVQVGSLSDMKADVLVNTASADLDLRHGAISQALLRKAGPELQNECKRKYSRGVRAGDVAITEGYGLQCKYVFHGALAPYRARDEAQCLTALRQFITACLTKASERQLKTIAFPAIGTGNLAYPVDVVAAEMFFCVERFRQNYPSSSILDVIFVVFGGDSSIVQTFQSFEKKMVDAQAAENKDQTTEDRDMFRITGLPENITKAKEAIEDKISTMQRVTYSVELPEGLMSQLRRVIHMEGRPLIQELSDGLRHKDVQLVDRPNYSELRSFSTSKLKAASSYIKQFCTESRISVHCDISTNYLMNYIIADVPMLKFELLVFFHKSMFQKYEIDGIRIYYKDDENAVVISGKLERVAVAKIQVENILKEILSRLFSDEVDTGKTHVDVETAMVTVQDKQRCVYLDGHTKKNTVVIYGEDKYEVANAKRLMSEGLSSSLGRRQAGSDVSVTKTSSDVNTMLQSGARNNKHLKNEESLLTADPKGSKIFSWNTDARNIKVFKTKEGIIIRVYEADILNLPVDCIVNATNDRLNHFGSVSSVIASAAGQSLVKEGDEYIKECGKLNVGEAVSTTAGDLPYKCVVHTVQPDWYSHRPHTVESVTGCERDLYEAVRNSLAEAGKKGLDTIALPGIGAGLSGVPKEICAGQYAEAVITYSRQAAARLKEVHFIDKSSETVRVIQDTFEAMITKSQVNPRSLHAYPSGGMSKHKQAARDKPDGTNVAENKPGVMSTKGKPNPQSPDAYSGEGMAKPHKAKTGETNRGPNVDQKQNVVPFYYDGAGKTRQQKTFVCRYGEHHELCVYTGDLLHLNNIEAIVCSEDATGQANGMVAKLLLKNGGPAYKQEKKDVFQRKMPTTGDVVTTNGGQLRYKWVLHALVPHITRFNYDVRQWQRHLRSMIDDIFNQIAASKYTSVVISLLGAGQQQVDPRVCAEVFYDSYTTFCRKYPHLHCRVHFVNKDAPKTNVVKQLFKYRIDAIQKTQPKPRTGTQTSSQTKSGSHPLSNADIDGAHKHTGPSHTQGNNPVGSHNQASWQSGSQRGNSRDDKITGAMPKVHRQPGNKQVEPTNKGNQGQGNVRDTQTDLPKGDNTEDCVICMDRMSNPRKLKCGHTFCTDCIEQHFVYKEACPTCGQVCGVITGDQPAGDMDVQYLHTSVAGYEECGSIAITYTFQSGKQKSSHPHPGQAYKGITRTAYLPDNQEGRLILEMLKVAFHRNIIFTIGTSRTTGKEDVITWNDIHHKTNPRPNQQFGYPDPTYLARVKDELAAKGVTEADVKEY